MTTQYKFCLIGIDGHISGRAIEHEARDDRSAIKEANLAATMHRVEIWEGARLVAYIVGDVTKQTPSARKPFVDQYK